MQKQKGSRSKIRNLIANLGRLSSHEARLGEVESKLKEVEAAIESQPLVVSYPPCYGDVLTDIKKKVAKIAEELEAQKALLNLSDLRTVGLGIIAVGLGFAAAKLTLSSTAFILVVIGLVLFGSSIIWHMFRRKHKS